MLKGRRKELCDKAMLCGALRARDPVKAPYGAGGPRQNPAVAGGLLRDQSGGGRRAR
jgi:hypothetical protein